MSVTVASAEIQKTVAEEAAKYGIKVVPVTPYYDTGKESKMKLGEFVVDQHRMSISERISFSIATAEERVLKQQQLRNDLIELKQLFDFFEVLHGQTKEWQRYIELWDKWLHS